MNRTSLTARMLPATGRALLVLGLAANLGCDLAMKEKPKAATELTATPEAITLIQATKDRCVRIAKTGLERARTAELDEERQQNDGDRAEPTSHSKYESPVAQAALELYLGGEALPEIAAVDKAGELIRDLLPQVKDEASPEITQAVKNLSAIQEQVCQHVRNARPTRLNYQENVDFAVHDFDTAAAKLDTLYTVSATDTQFALSKFNPLLDEARSGTDHPAASPIRKMTPEQLSQQRKEWEASQELQQHQQAEHDAAVVRWRQRQEGKAPILAKVGAAPDLAAKSSLPPEKKRQTMEAWSATYAARVAPVRTALASYLNLRRIGTPEQVQPVCQQLLDATTALNADSAALDPPDEGASRSLKKAYGDLQECARNCINGQTAEAAFRLAYYQRALGEATTALQPFNVTP
ncbi:MAG TPA: hypothetical protein VGG20_28940 [Thermoanaerobaculia bacterium]